MTCLFYPFPLIPPARGGKPLGASPSAVSLILGELIYHRHTVLELKYFLVRIQTAIFFKFLKPVLKPYSTVKHKIKFQ